MDEVFHPPGRWRRSDTRFVVPRPNPNVRRAVWLMLIGAGLEIAAAVVAINTEPSLVPWFNSHSPRPGTSLMRTLVSAQGQTEMYLSLEAAACWLVMAYANRAARSDAPRIISAFLFVMGIASLQLDFSAPRSAASIALSFVICLVGLGVVLLLFSDELQRVIGFERKHLSAV